VKKTAFSKSCAPLAVKKTGFLRNILADGDKISKIFANRKTENAYIYLVMSTVGPKKDFSQRGCLLTSRRQK
jgi:hypothetical protein